MYSKKTFKLILFISLLILPLQVFSFFQYSSLVLIRGNFTEEVSNKPIATVMQFTEADGKVVECRSNTNAGEFQQVLRPNCNYTLAAKGYIITPGMEHFGTPSKNEYVEITKNFTARKIVEGMQVMNIQAFKPNESKLSQESKDRFMDLKAFLRFNIAISIKIELSSNDSYLKPTKEKETYTKKNKTATRMRTVSSKERLERLLLERENSLRAYFEEIRLYLKNVEFSHIVQESSGSKNKGKSSKKSGRGSDQSSQASNNVNVLISKVREL